MINFACSAPTRGAYASSRTWSGMRWTPSCLLTSGTEADGKGVWSWRPNGLAPNRRRCLKHIAAMTVANDKVHRGERAISRKTIAQGRPVVTACTCGFRACASLLLRGSPGCSGHPAFPAPSPCREGKRISKTRAQRAARMQVCEVLRSRSCVRGLVCEVLQDSRP